MFFLLVPPTVQVFIEDTSNVQNFLILSKCIYTPLKRVSKVTVLDVGKSQIGVLITFFFYVSLHLPNFSFGPILNPRPH